MKNKDVIYIDVEDEITNIIDKVNSSKSKVVALVLPKRATVFQSIVNMKLLKKKADDVKKNVVLVTSEPGILPLAGATGVYVANSLQATPTVPPDPNVAFDDETPLSMEDEGDSEDTEETDELDKNKPIGELAGLAAVGAAVNKQDDPEDNIEFDNDAVPEDLMGLDAIDKETPKKKDKKDKKAKGLNGKSTKVPNFERFRKWLIIGGIALVALIVFYIVGFRVLPKATIIIQTNTSTISSNLSLTLSQANQNLDPTNDVVPAKYQTVTKTSTSTPVNTTGSKTIGTSATGSVTITNPCDPINGSTSPVTVPAGTVFTDSNNNNYTSNNSVTVPGYADSHGKCQKGVATAQVTAASVGSGYNNSQSGASYSTQDGDISSYTITGGPMSGGSSSTVQAVAQADVTSAQSQLTTPNSSQIESQLESSLNSAGYAPINATYSAGTPSYTPSAAVGSQANSVTVTETVVYSMYGAKESDLNTLVLNNVNQQINSANQSILDSGTSNAKFTLVTGTSSTTASSKVTMQTESTIGPKLNATTIAQQSAGQLSGDIKSNINTVPGVTSVNVKYSPFWVTSTPKNVKKITVIIEKSDGSTP